MVPMVVVHNHQVVVVPAQVLQAQELTVHLLVAQLQQVAQVPIPVETEVQQPIAVIAVVMVMVVQVLHQEEAEAEHMRSVLHEADQQDLVVLVVQVR